MNIKQFELMHNTCDTFFESLGDPGRINFNAGYRCSHDRAEAVLVKALEFECYCSGKGKCDPCRTLKKWRCEK